MAIGAIESQGQILRTQDYSALKHQEDVRPQVEQANIQQSRNAQEIRQFNRVNNAEQSGRGHMHSDASEQGQNEYTGDGGNRRNEARAAKAAREAREADGKVFIKAVR